MQHHAFRKRTCVITNLDPDPDPDLDPDPNLDPDLNLAPDLDPDLKVIFVYFRGQ